MALKNVIDFFQSMTSIEDKKKRDLSKVEKAYLKRVGLGDLMRIYYADPLMRDKQYYLYLFFISTKGRRLIQMLNKRLPWKERIIGIVGEYNSLQIKVKYAVDALMSRNIDLSSVRLVDYFEIALKNGPKVYGDPFNIFLSLVLLFVRQGFSIDQKNKSRFIEFLDKFEPVDELDDWTATLFAYAFLESWLRVAWGNLENTELNETEFFEKIEFLLSNNIFNYSRDVLDVLVGSRSVLFLGMFYLQIILAVYSMTSGNSGLSVKLIELSKKKEEGLALLQMLKHLNTKFYPLLRDVLKYSPKNFYKYLLLIVKSEILVRTKKIGENPFLGLSSPDLEFGEFAEFSKELKTFQTHGHLLKRRDTLSSSLGEQGVQNLTKEFAGPYFAEALRQVGEIVDGKFELMFAELKKVNPAIRIEDLLKFEFMYERYFQASVAGTYPYPNAGDILAARTVVDAVLAGKHDLKKSEKNIAWAKEVFGSRWEEWLSRDEKRIYELGRKGTSLKKIIIEKTTTAAETLLVGDIVNGSCYRPEGVNYWMSFLQALDANRSVYLIKGTDGSVLGRFLSVVTNKGEIAFLPIYYSKPNLDFDDIQKRYAVDVANRYGLKILDEMPHDTNLNFSFSVNDQPVSISNYLGILVRAKERAKRWLSNKAKIH